MTMSDDVMIIINFPCYPLIQIITNPGGLHTVVFHI